MVKLSTQLQTESDRRTRTDRVLARQEYERPVPKSAQQQEYEQQLSQVNQNLSDAEKELEQLDAERKEKIRLNTLSDGGYQARRQINDRYYKQMESVRAKIRALNQVKKQLNQGYIVEGYEGYVESYQRQSDQDRERSLRREESIRELKIKQEEEKERIAREKTWLEYYGDQVAQKIALGKEDDLMVKEYRRIAGEQQYQKSKAVITEEYQKQLDQAYQDWQESRATKPYEIPFTTSDLPLPYQTRGTISDQPVSNVYEYKIESDAEPSTVSKILKKVTTNLGKIHWYYSPKGAGGIGSGVVGTGIGSFGGLSMWKWKESDIDLTEGIREYRSDLSEKAKDVVMQEVIGRGIKEQVEPKYQERYQTAFEDKYMKDIIYDPDFDFEKAEKEFGESRTARIIAEDYNKEIQDERRALGLTVAGFKIFGYTTASSVLGLVETPVSTATTTAVVGSGYYALSSLPSWVGTGITAGTFGYGTYKTLSPTSLPEERAGGLITAVISGSLLTYQGVRYLRSPSIRTAPVKAPKPTAKSTSTVGKDVKIITDQGEINKVLYQQQKLSQVGVAGRRTIVTTKWRELLERYTGIKVDPIYQGIPYAQKGTTYTLQSLRGTYQYSTPSGYQKAYTKLTKYGWTSSQAKATLRYYQPKLIETGLEKGILIIKGNKAIGEFTYTTKQPVIDIDKNLGIKTRGARTIQDVYKVQRQIIDLEKGGQIVFETRSGVSTYLSRGSTPSAIKDVSYNYGFIKAKSTDTLKGYELLKTDDLTKMKIYQPVDYKDIASITASREFKLSAKPNKLKLDVGSRIDISKTKIIDKIADLTKKQGIGTGTISTGKTQTTTSSSQAISNAVEKVIGKLEGSSGLGSQVKLTSAIKSSPALETKSITDIKQIINLDIATKTALATSTSNAIASLSVASLKPATQVKLGLDLRESNALKNAIKTAQFPVSRTAQQVTQLSSLETIPTIKLPSVDLTFPTNIEPTIKIPPVIPVIFPPALQKKQKKSAESKTIQQYAYLPDFTSRALGLEAEEITGKQAQKRLKKLLTGLEIRRPVKIKGWQ